MKQQCISFQTAELAHQKGFRSDDILNARAGCYILEDLKVWRVGVPDNWKEEIERGHYFKKEPTLTMEYRNRWRELIAWAPPQALLQKWLREEHDIHVWCRHHATYYKWWVNNKSLEQDDYKSYEEALEIGLQRGLKLIKQNDNRT